MGGKRRAKKKHSGKALFLAIIIIVAVVAGYYVYTHYIKKETFIAAEGEISFHFIKSGNYYAGDCIYVKAGDNDILIDAGSRSGSAANIRAYLSEYVADGKLEYVIATHADQDHIAAFGTAGGVFDSFKCGVIIDFPKTNKTNDKATKTLEKYIERRNEEVTSDGAVHYDALQCYKEEGGAKRVYDLTENGNIKMEILYNYYYENKSSDENNYSVCVQFYHGSRKFLFTGDLERDGEERLVKNNKDSLSQVELYKAGHHGSKTSSNDALLSVIKPKICVVMCVAGTSEYTPTEENKFPTQAFINRIAKYTDKVYVPTVVVDDNAKTFEDMNGEIVVVSEAEKDVYVKCSASDTVLKDTEWFKKFRSLPAAWAAQAS